MEGPISFWGYKEQETHLTLREHDDDDDDDDDEFLFLTIGRDGSLFMEFLPIPHVKYNTQQPHSCIKQYFAYV
jgi:hypothetical protein